MATTREALAKATVYWFKPADLIHPEKGHDLYDPRSEEPPDPQLMALMKEHGWIGPPMQAASEEGVLYIADGRRRHRAAEALAKKGNPIRCKVEITKGEAFDAMLVGNLGRKEETPLQLASKALKLKNMGHNEKEIAKKFGVEEATIRNYLALAVAPKDVKAAVATGQVTATLAKDLAKQPAEERAKILADGPVKGEAGKARVRGVSKSKKVPATMVKALWKDLPPDDKGFKGFARALLGFLLGEDPKGEALNQFTQGAEIVKKVGARG
jgi:ParB/RepB/Spo0J family partition protein